MVFMHLLPGALTKVLDGMQILSKGKNRQDGVNSWISRRRF